MAKRDNQKIKSGFGVETPPVGLFPAGSIVRVSGNKVITECAIDFDQYNVSPALRQKAESLLQRASSAVREKDCESALESIFYCEKEDETRESKMDEFASVFFSPTEDLFYACTSEYSGLEKIENLLKSGISPNGLVWDIFQADNFYTVLALALRGYDGEESHLPEITELLLQYGLDIEHPIIPYDDYDYTNPMTVFGMFGDAYVPTLAVFLRHGISAESVDACLMTCVPDLIYVNTDVLDPQYVGTEPNYFFQAVRMLMLVCSYPEISAQLEWVRKFMDFEKNSYELSKFRDYNNYDFSLVFPNEEEPKPEGCEVSIVEKGSEKTVWKFVFSW